MGRHRAMFLDLVVVPQRHSTALQPGAWRPPINVLDRRRVLVESQLFPELIQPDVEAVKPVVVYGVDASGALRGHNDEVALSQGPQVLGYGWPTDRQSFCQLVHGFRCTPNLLQQEPAVRIGDGGEGIMV